MGYRFLMLTLAASVCARLPTTNLVVPEMRNFAAHSTADSFIQAITKSGGSKTDCRTFAETAISDISTGVTSEQGVLGDIDTGATCAQQGQTLVGTTQVTLTAALADLATKQATAATALITKNTACSASVTFAVNLDILEATACYDYTNEGTYISADGACVLATTDLATADADVASAQTAVTDAQAAYDAAVAEAARLKSACHCRVQHEQAAAWTAASAATAAHAADWKQAHEVVCAIDQTSTCTVPTCPEVTKPTLSSDVSGEECDGVAIPADESVTEDRRDLRCPTQNTWGKCVNVGYRNVPVKLCDDGAYVMQHTVVSKRRSNANEQQFVCTGKASNVWGVHQAYHHDCKATSPETATRESMWTNDGTTNRCYFGCDTCDSV